MKRNVLLTAILLCAPAFVGAQNVTLPVPEVDIIAATMEADYDANGIAVNSSGTIYAVDTEAGDYILRITPGSPNTVEVMATGADLFAAMDAANGSNGASAFNPRQIAVAGDGDLIVLGFASGTTADTILSLTDTAPATISVVYTPIDAATSVLDGSSALICIGNTAYVSTDTNNGTTNSLWSVDTNSGNTVPTELVSESDLSTFYSGGITNTDLGLNALTTDGTDILASVSATATAPNDVLRITTGGSISLEVSGSNILASLQTLDGTATGLGFGAITVDGAGEIWLANSFGDGLYGDGLLELTAISGGDATVRGITAAEIDSGTGSTGPFIGNDGMVYDSTNDRILFSSGDSGGEGIGAADVNSNIRDWMLHY